MSYLLDKNVKFPYCDIYTIYLKCGQHKKLRDLFLHQISQIYTECIDVIYPVLDNYIPNQHSTWGINILDAVTYYNNFGNNEVYPWHVNPIAVQVPYGNIDAWQYNSTDWRVHMTRTLRSMWHGIRLIPNDLETQRKPINIQIPWILLDKDPGDLTDYELYDYVELLLSSIGPHIWVQDRRIITPHVHVS